MPNRKTLVLSINESLELNPKEDKDMDREFINIDYNKPIDVKGVFARTYDDGKSGSSFILYMQHPRQKDPQKDPSMRLFNNMLLSDIPGVVSLYVGPLYYLNNQLVTAALVIYNVLYDPDGKEPDGASPLKGIAQIVPIVADTDTTAGTETITEIVEAMKRAGVGPDTPSTPDLDVEMNLNNFVSSNTPIFAALDNRNTVVVFYGMDASIPILPETFYDLATLIDKQLRSREQDYSGVEETFKRIEKRAGGLSEFSKENFMKTYYIKDGEF